jgi:hypothetical protein
MPVELNEPVIRAIEQRLVDGLPAVIADINLAGAATDGFTLVEPTILTYIPPPSDLLEPPVIGIGDAPTQFEDDTGFSATGRHELLIVAYDQSSEQEALAWKLRRWMQAIARIVLDGRSLGDGAWGTGLRGTAPGRTLVDNADDPREWFSWSGIRIWAKRDEDWD